MTKLLSSVPVGNFRELFSLERTKQFTPLPSFFHSKLGYLLFSTGTLWSILCHKAARTAAQHCMGEMREEKLYFVLLESVKRQKGLLGKSVSSNFVADCGFFLAVQTLRN